MDNVSHSLTGLVLAQAGLRRLTPYSTAILVIAANAPDIDIVTLAGGPLQYLESHRAYTHSLLFLPLMAIISVLLVSAIFRQRLPWGRAWLLGCVGVASHLLLDWTNSYGIRLLLPFSSQWFHLDLNGLYDGFFLLVLVIAALWPVLANLVSGEIGDRSSNGRGVAIAAITAIVLFECGRGVLHARAVGQLQSRLYEEQQPLQVAALPDAYNPFRWRGVVETENAYFAVPLTSGSKPILEEVQPFYKPPQEPVVSALKSDENFRFFSYFARFPVWSLVPVNVSNGRGTRADLTDLRFGVPGSGAFHCVALLDSQSRVIESYFTYGDPNKADAP